MILKKRYIDVDNEISKKFMDPCLFIKLKTGET